MAIFWMIVGTVVAAVIIAVTLLAPAPTRWTNLVTHVAFWRRRSVRLRLGQRRPLILTYLGLAAIAAIVLVIWVLPSVLTLARTRPVAETQELGQGSGLWHGSSISG